MYIGSQLVLAYSRMDRASPPLYQDAGFEHQRFSHAIINVLSTKLALFNEQLFLVHLPPGPLESSTSPRSRPTFHPCLLQAQHHLVEFPRRNEPGRIQGPS